MCRLILPSLTLLLLLTTTSATQEKTPVKTEQTWSGKLPGQDKEALAKYAPESGVISDAKTFAKLWQAWRTEEKVPEIDFAKKIVLVATAKGPNLVALRPSLDGAGNLTFMATSTLIGGPGFGYQLAVVDRAGLKTVNKKALPAAGK